MYSENYDPQQLCGCPLNFGVDWREVMYRFWSGVLSSQVSLGVYRSVHMTDPKEVCLSNILDYLSCFKREFDEKKTCHTLIPVPKMIHF